jgi:phosphoribosylformylglycinamidine cyclo-ligase
VIFSPAIAALQKAVDVRGVAHITGGGIPGNLNRVLPRGTAAEVTRGSWEVPPIFGEIQRLGSVADDEMSRVFNMGVGMIVVVSESDSFKALDTARASGHRATVIGHIVEGDGTVRVV